MSDLRPFLQVAQAAAAAASVPVLRYFHDAFEVETKQDQTPVTVADREAEQCIRRVIRDAYPNHAIYGEEYGRCGSGSEFLWLVDPIDGTKSFVKGYGMFSTQIALMHGDDIVIGVSHAPLNGETAWAVRGLGAWVNDTRATISDQPRCAGASISTGNIAGLAASRQWAALGAVLAEAGRTRGYGDYYHYHRLAAGQIDAVIESEVNILDIAALSLIVSEAGGTFTDLSGAPVGLETRSVLAANPSLHSELLERLTEVKA